MHTVCFTGHRHVTDAEHAWLDDALEHEIERQIQNGARIFRAGGALGFDTMAALCVIKMKEKYPDVSLELVFPCPEQTKNWKADDRLLYEQIKERADSRQYVSDFYFQGVMQNRNRALVDGADLCIAFLRGETGGTAYTVSYAQKKGTPVICLRPPFQDQLSWSFE